MIVILAIAIGATSGSLIRYFTANMVVHYWPQHVYIATLLVNIVGCFSIGCLYGIFLVRPDASLALKAGLIIGFLGSLTTFSSFSLDTFKLIESGQLFVAIGYILLSVLAGLLATASGLFLTEL